MRSKKFNTVKELVAFYNGIKGMSLSKIKGIIEREYPEISKKLTTNKGIVGHVLEAYIGNAPNSNSNADVIEIGVELKVLPLRKISSELQPKERSKIKSIDYNELAKYVWDDSKVKKKMNKILFLLYEQPIGLSYKDWETSGFIFHGPLLYTLEDENEEQISLDYTILQRKAQSGHANLISEGDTRILGAATSGTGKMVTYLEKFEAKQRSYVLKQPFLKQFYLERFKKQKFVDLKAPANESPQEFVLRMIQEKLSNKTFNEVAKTYGLNLDSQSKSISREIINKALSLDENTSVRELERAGLVLKTVPVNDDLVPYESMSFPKFSLADIINEYWDGEDSIDDNLEGTNVACFRELIERPFIFLPVKKQKVNKKWNPVGEWIVGNPVLWEPSQDELKIIQEQWGIVKSIAQEGVDVKRVKYGKGLRQENNLIKASDDKIVHVRPHGKDSSDIDRPYEKLKAIKITWQSFWLNAKFVEEVINRR